MNENYKSNSKTQWNVIGRQRETDKEPETKTVMTYKTEYSTGRKITGKWNTVYTVQFIMRKDRETKPNRWQSEHVIIAVKGNWDTVLYNS